MDVREHIYSNYTTTQTRSTDMASLQAAVASEHRSLLSSIIPHLPSNRQSSILDAGCGYGAMLLLLQQLGYTHTKGVDISAEQVSIARKLGVLNIQQGALTDALNGDDVYDAVLMMDVIEHLTRSEALDTLVAIHKCLKPGGVLVMRTPNVDGMHGTVLSYGDVTHEMHLNVLSVREIFASLPYGSVDTYGYHATEANPLRAILRAVALRLVRACRRVSAFAAGVSYGMFLDSPNMIIVARKASE